MKKIIKLFLCLLMLVSFTNITKVLGEEDYVSVDDVVENFSKTNFMEALLIQARRENPDAELKLNYDKDNHKIEILDDDDSVLLTFVYTDEVISLFGTAPETADDVDLGLILGQTIYFQNMVYAVFDTMGYSDKDVEINDEEIDINEEFFNEYGVLFETEDYEFEDEDGSVSGSYIKELRVSLNKEKIANLIEEFGVDRPDYVAMTQLQKPEVTVTKKGSILILNWDEDDNADKFIVYRTDKKGGTYKKVAKVTTNRYVDRNVTYGKTYYYKVRAIGLGEKKYSNEVKYKLVPLKVTNVKLSAIKANSIKVSYDKQSESGYSIERSTNNKTWTVVKTITKNSTLSFNNTGLKANTKYYYRVRAYKTVSGKKVYGAYSDVVMAKTLLDKPTVTIKENTYQSLKLTISAVKGASYYMIYRSDEEKGEYVFVDSTDKTSFVDSGLGFNETYYYKVRACNADNKCGSYSSVISAKVKIKTPSIKLESSADVPMTIKVSGLNETDGYLVFRSTDNSRFTRIADVSSDSSTYRDLTAKKNVTYYYKVKTYIYWNDKQKYSGFSAVKSLKNLYNKTVVATKEALSPVEFDGVYKKGNVILKLQSITEEKNSADFAIGNAGAMYVLQYVDGKLFYEDEYETVTIQRTTTNGVKVTGVSNDKDGVYEGLREYHFDEFFQDMFGGAELETKYNGKFMSDGHEEINLLQYNEDGVHLVGAVKENEKLDLYLGINGEKATTMEDGIIHEVVVNDGVLTYKQFEGEEEIYSKVLTKQPDLTEFEIAQIFL